MIRISRKNTTKKIKEPEKHNKKPLAYIATYNKNPELFTEIIKKSRRNWKQSQNQRNTKRQKSLKARYNPKILKEYAPLLHSEKTQEITKCNKKLCKICDIIIEGKSYNFKHAETKFKMNKNLSCNSKNILYIIKCSKSKKKYT